MRPVGQMRLMWRAAAALPTRELLLTFLTRAFRHAARGIAFAAKGDTKSAPIEQAAFL
jgi:hypothetical protein